MKEILKGCSALLLILLMTVCLAEGQVNPKPVIPAAERVIMYKPTLKNKTIAVVANHTSMVGKVHLVDTLLRLGANIKKIFCPEHGFRGNEDAGKTIKSGKDTKTGIPIISLYGKKVKPAAADLAGIDVVIYDIQDVGVRYYTYISTLFYVMQGCAENLKLLMVLDRPNPNGFYVDGPVLDMKYKSFVGVVPIPLVYGMTAGELATMINEEGWLPNKLECSLGVIPCLNYTHKTRYQLPVRPSPNLRNMSAIYLYPSLGLFEGTSMNVGRGTEMPFQVFGNPRYLDTTFRYIPDSASGAPHRGKACYGMDLRNLSEGELAEKRAINLDYLKEAIRNYPDKDKFFNSFFENLSGDGRLRKQLLSDVSNDSIYHSWQPGLAKFKEIRKKYLIYEDFEQ